MTTIRFAFLLALVALAHAAPAHALRCGSRVIATGEHELVVRERCGEPYWIEDRSEVLVAGEFGPIEQRVERRIEAWYFNFGPNRLLHRLVFRDGRLVEETTLGYGFSRLGVKCDLDMLTNGATTGEVVARCGAPRSHDTRHAQVIVRDDFGNARQRLVRREEWVYDPEGGNTRNARLLLFVDGTLQGVERLD